jgi:ferrous iron transport protein A
MDNYAPTPISLADLSSGKQAILLKMNLAKTSANRLVSLGFTPGVAIQVVQNYGHGPLVVSVRGMRVALGRQEACDLLVKRASE